MHLKTNDVVKVVRNFVDSSSKFLLTTSFPNINVRFWCKFDFMLSISVKWGVGCWYKWKMESIQSLPGTFLLATSNLSHSRCSSCSYHSWLYHAVGPFHHQSTEAFHLKGKCFSVPIFKNIILFFFVLTLCFYLYIPFFRILNLFILTEISWSSSSDIVSSLLLWCFLFIIFLICLQPPEKTGKFFWNIQKKL